MLGICWLSFSYNVKSHWRTSSTTLSKCELSASNETYLLIYIPNTQRKMLKREHSHTYWILFALLRHDLSLPCRKQTCSYSAILYATWVSGKTSTAAEKFSSFISPYSWEVFQRVVRVVCVHALAVL